MMLMSAFTRRSFILTFERSKTSEADGKVEIGKSDSERDLNNEKKPIRSTAF